MRGSRPLLAHAQNLLICAQAPAATGPTLGPGPATVTDETTALLHGRYENNEEPDVGLVNAYLVALHVLDLLGYRSVQGTGGARVSLIW